MVSGRCRSASPPSQYVVATDLEAVEMLDRSTHPADLHVHSRAVDLAQTDGHPRVIARRIAPGRTHPADQIPLAEDADELVAFDARR